MDKLKQKIGIIGGGQLGKMMILEAKKMGFAVNILDPTPDCPAHSIADVHIVAPFDDAAAIKQLAAISDVLTYELEHISIAPLTELAADGHRIYPSPRALGLIQNKLTQKQALQDAGLPVPPFAAVSSTDEIIEAARIFDTPLMLKACMGGYDGKGNAVIHSLEDIDTCYALLGEGKIPLMAEKWVPFEKEISVLACRSATGENRVFPVAENRHKDSVLMETRVPANISDTLARKAMAIAAQTQDVFDGVGMFCVEMFLTGDGELLINEIAPRPHNSGHYTIEACFVSQFQQHIRAVAGLPLGDCALRSPAVMRNLLGPENETGAAMVRGAGESLAIDGFALHVYGKTAAAPRRKMGHFTVIAPTLEAAAEKAARAAKIVSIGGGDPL